MGAFCGHINRLGTRVSRLLSGHHGTSEQRRDLDRPAATDGGSLEKPRQTAEFERTHRSRR